MLTDDVYVRDRAMCDYDDAVIAWLKYAASHEWAKIEGDVATIGITDHAQVRARRQPLGGPPARPRRSPSRLGHALTV